MSKQIKRFYEFGAFRIDTANRLLLNDGEPVPLKAKAIDTLLLLVEHNGEVVEKDELMKELWPDSFVEEGNLTQNIMCCARPWAKVATSKPFRDAVTGFRPR